VTFVSTSIPLSSNRVGANAPRARHAPSHQPARRRAVPLALACLAGLGACQAHAGHKSRPAKPASAPTTAQILAPSRATVPDVLPPDTTVYRCGSAYSSHPCAGGDSAPLDVADARSDAQRRQSQDVAARDQRLAAWYEAGRLQREAAASRPARGASAVGGCVATKVKGRGKPCPPAAKDPFAPHMQRVVVVPGSGKSGN